MSFTEKNFTAHKPTAPLPQGFSIRPARLDDAAPLVEMFNAGSRQMVGYDDFTVLELLNDYGSPNFEIERDARVVLNPQGEIVAYQDVFATNPIPVHPPVWGRVHPDYTGLGLGTALLQWGVQHAHHVLDKVPPEARVAVHAYSEFNWPPSVKLIESNGFEAARHYFRMRIDMDAPPPTPHWPPGITLENCSFPDGVEAFYRAYDEAFEDHFGHIDQPYKQAFEHWKHQRLNDDGFDPSLWFQAMDGNQIAGFCLGRKQGWESEQHGFVNLLGVRRPWRKSGLGLALLHHIFNVYWGRGQHTVALGVDADSLTGAVRLYEKAGMRVHQQTTSFELEIRPGVELTKTDSEE